MRRTLGVVDAHVHIGWSDGYYFKRHGRRGLDGRDRPTITVVNAVTPQAALSLPPSLVEGDLKVGPR